MNHLAELLRQAEAALARAEADTDTLREAVTALRRIGADKPTVKPPRDVFVVSPDDLSGMSGPEAAYSVLVDAGGPLPMKEIVERIQARGYKPDADPGRIYTTLFTNMSRKKHQFRRLAKARFEAIQPAAS